MWSVILVLFLGLSARCSALEHKRSMNDNLPQKTMFVLFVCIWFLTLNLSFTAALIIGGIGSDDGQYTGHDQTVEIYIPSLNKTCTLPNMPDRRTYFSINGNLVCGGMHAKPSPGAWSTCTIVTLVLNLTWHRGPGPWPIRWMSADLNMFPPRVDQAPTAWGTTLFS